MSTARRITREPDRLIGQVTASAPRCVGALNWGIVGVTGGETNVLSEVFGTGTLTDIVYVVIGVAGLVYIPRLLDALQIGAGPHPRGT